MANLFKLQSGKLFSVVGKLAEGGLTAEMAEEIDRDPALVPVMVEALLRQPIFTLVHGIFTKPEKQIVRVRELNLERGWGISDKEFAAVEKSIPAWPEDKLVAVTLVPYLDDEKDGRKGVERTFHELWEVAAKEQYANYLWDGYDKAGPDKLRLLKGIKHKPGLRWEVIDLGCNRNRKPADVRDPQSSPHAGILAAAALHPQWVKIMDGEKTPFVWGPGYEVDVSGVGSWLGVPYLFFSRDARKIGLLYGGCDCGYSDWAVPSFVRE